MPKVGLSLWLNASLQDVPVFGATDSEWCFVPTSPRTFVLGNVSAVLPTNDTSLSPSYCSVQGSGAPRIDSYTGSFTDGVDTRFRWPKKSRRSGKVVNKLKDEYKEDDDSSKYDRASNAGRRSRPRVRYFKAGNSRTEMILFRVVRNS